MKIKLATEKDFSNIRAVHYTAGKFMFKDNFHYVPLSDEKLSKRAKKGTLWMALDGNDNIIAFNCCNKYSNTHIFIEQISVHPKYMRQVVALSLMKRLVDYSRKNDLTSISLTTTASVPWSEGLYGKCGFEIVDEDDLCKFLRYEIEDDLRNGRTNRIAMRMNIKF